MVIFTVTITVTQRTEWFARAATTTATATAITDNALVIRIIEHRNTTACHAGTVIILKQT